MNKIDKLLVCLDLTDMDRVLVKYASYLSRLAGVKKVYFMHAFEYDELPDRLSKEFGIDESLDNLIKEEIAESIEKFFLSEETETEIKIMEGRKMTSVLQWSEAEKMDLVLVGKKNTFRGKGNFAGKVARLSHCSVLFITETTRGYIKKILVPVDFSSFAEHALKSALFFAEKAEAEVICQNVYRLPPQYFPYIKNNKESIEEIKKDHEKHFSKFLKHAGLPKDTVHCECSVDHENNVADEIYSYAVEQNADLIVVGSKGKTDAASFLLGSVSDRLISNDKTLAVLVVKDKAESMGLLDALLKL